MLTFDIPLRRLERTLSLFMAGTAKLKIVNTNQLKNEVSLAYLCAHVKNMRCAYEDCAELIEDKAFEECAGDKLESVVNELSSLAAFFESLPNKNEEVDRDLADLYLLTGQIYQYAEKFEESISWFTKAIVVDDQYPVPYHSIALSFIKMKSPDKAIKSLEQEIMVCPGNYYSYLFLVDLYTKEKRYDEAESTLKKLLERDPENVQGLHKLIKFYENSGIDDVRLLRRRLLGKNGHLNRLDSIIKVYHFCKENRLKHALEFLDEWYKESPDLTIIHLIKAYVLGELRQFKRKRLELAAFKSHNNGREDLIKAKLDEFESVFGTDAKRKLKQHLLLSNPLI